MILIAIFLCCMHAVQAQPTIASVDLLVVGEEETLSCSFTTAETVSSNPLTWTRGSSPLVPSSSQTINGSSGIKIYNIAYTFTVAASDNNVVLTCTASFPSGTTTVTKTLFVYKGPDPPVVSGPSSVASGVTSTWTCVVDGASHTAPNVYWEFGNRSRLPSNTFSNRGEAYRDSNNLEIHKQNSVLKLTLSTGAPNFTLACHGVHFDTNKRVVSSFAVTVSPGPVTYLTSRSPQDESPTVTTGQITGLTSSSPQAGTLTVTAGPVTGLPRSPQDEPSDVTASENEKDEAGDVSGSSYILSISLGIVGVGLTLVFGLGVALMWWKKARGREENTAANVKTGPQSNAPENPSTAASNAPHDNNPGPPSACMTLPGPQSNAPANPSTAASNAPHDNPVPPSASSVGSTTSTSSPSAADSKQPQEFLGSVSETSEASEASEGSEATEVSAFTEESEV